MFKYSKVLGILDSYNAILGYPVNILFVNVCLRGNWFMLDLFDKEKYEINLNLALYIDETYHPPTVQTVSR